VTSEETAVVILKAMAISDLNFVINAETGEDGDRRNE
jgi:hypothetical protein